MGVTTRSEIALHRFTANPQGLRVARIGFGSHGIKPVADTYFDAGLRIRPITPTSEFWRRLQTGWSACNRRSAYILRRRLHGIIREASSTRDRCRLSYGRSSLRRRPTNNAATSPKVSRIDSKRVDFVGVIPIGTEDSPRAIVALTKNRSLHFFRDPFTSPNIDSLQLFVPGTAYRFIRHGIHLILLTSKGLCCAQHIRGIPQRGSYRGLSQSPVR